MGFTKFIAGSDVTGLRSADDTMRSNSENVSIMEPKIDFLLDTAESRQKEN